MGMLLTQYFILSIIVVVSSIRISSCVDEFTKRTKIGGAFISGIVLAGVTSLPELITSLSSTIVLNNADLAMGDILGSNAFNIFILAVGNLIFIKSRLFNWTKQLNVKTNVLSTFVYFFIFLNLYGFLTGRIGHIGITSFFILILYYINIRLVADGEEQELLNPKVTCRLRVLVYQFILSAIVIVVSSLLISVVTDKIARISGIGSSFIGAMFLGVATSLPEMASLVSLVRLKNYDLAVGNIVGSNLFNFVIIALADICYVSGSIFEFLDTSNRLLVIVGLLESILLTYMLLRKEVKNLLLYVLPSLMIIFIYFYYLRLSLNNG